MPGLLQKILPPLPPWDGLHVLIIHFPIALLIAAPLLVFIGAVWRNPKYQRGILISGLIVMALGAAGAILAVETGEAAMQLVDQTDEIRPVLETHADLGEWVRDIYITLSIVFAVILFLPPLLKKTLSPRAELAIHLVFLAIYCGGLLVLVNGAHLGGVMVHRFGIHAMFE